MKPVFQAWLAGGTGAALLAVPATSFAAGSPFGVLTPDSSVAIPAGPFQGFVNWAMTMQMAFYHDLTGALSHLDHSSQASWLIVGVSFLYGVFHAVGPGHGKAVITSYIMASGDTLKRGVAISFAAALVQALSAILIVIIAKTILGVTAVTLKHGTDWIEVASYSMIVVMGAALLWRKGISPVFAAYRSHGEAHAAHAECGCGHDHHALVKPDHHSEHDHHHEHGHGHAHDHDHERHHEHDHHHDHGPGCGCVHAADPATLKEPLPLSRAIALILAIGIRPCSGALIVLVFALSQKLFAAGVLSTLVMGLGTGLTVSMLAVFAATSRKTAMRLAGTRAGWASGIALSFEIGGALIILAFGSVMLTGSLAAGSFG